MLLLQFRFLCQSGPDPPPKKKVKLNEEEKRKENQKKSEGCITKSKSQRTQGSFQNAWLSQFGWLIFDKENQICVVCVCVVLQKIGFQNLYPLEYFKEVENTL